VKVRFAYEGSDSLDEAERVWLVSDDGKEQEFVVREVLGQGAHTLLGLEGVDDRDAAAKLTGSHLEVARDEVAPLAPGEYYLADLVGAEVVGPDGRVGDVVGVVVNPSIDCVRIRMTDGRLVEQPLAEPWVRAVDVESRRIELATLDGLIV
jgi:16S rRNA processing protein RimM